VLAVASGRADQAHVVAEDAVRQPRRRPHCGLSRWRARSSSAAGCFRCTTRQAALPWPPRPGRRATGEGRPSQRPQ
jgi:hypothetical protein